jgi:hypothetical protein
VLAVPNFSSPWWARARPRRSPGTGSGPVDQCFSRRGVQHRLAAIIGRNRVGESRDYYRGFIRLQSDLNYPLRIFSLNYDGMVERLDKPQFRVEAGFGGHGTNHVWDWERFEHSDTGSNVLPQVFLYKIHGSIDWKRDAAQNLYRVEQIERVEPDRMEIISGRDFKLEAADPLFILCL